MTEPNSILDMITGLGNDRPYPSELYLAVADALLACTRDECHPVLYEDREKYAESLRAMAKAPDHESHKASLRTIIFFVYPLQVRLYL